MQVHDQAVHISQGRQLLKLQVLAACIAPMKCRPCSQASPASDDEAVVLAQPHTGNLQTKPQVAMGNTVYKET